MKFEIFSSRLCSSTICVGIYNKHKKNSTTADLIYGAFPCKVESRLKREFIFPT